MLRHSLALAALTSFLGYPASGLDLHSPNGSVRLRLSAETGHLVYQILVEEHVRLASAPLGIIVDGSDLGAAAISGEVLSKKYSEVFPWRGNKAFATNLCNAWIIPMRSENGINWALEVRVFDEGAGFRYRIPGTGTRKISGESTEWKIPRDATLWFQTDTRNYEGIYQSARADAVPLQEEIKKLKQDTHLGPPVTVSYAGGGFAMLTEAALYRYSGLTLRPRGEARFTAAFQDDPEGWTHDGEILSPWRVVLLSADLNGLANNDVIAALCDPPDPKLFPGGINTSWIKPGKAPCTWMVYGNDGAQWDRQKWFVDISAAIGCEYLLVDAGWRTERWGWLKNGGDPWKRAAELCDYAKQRNVGIILWHAFPEGRDDGPGLTTVAAREELFENCKRSGVKGVKIDFFDSESKEVIEAYEDLLRRSAQHQLMINFHGANKPTGEARTWPNEITREGIREQEYVLWSVVPLEHYGALPFTRMVAGHADFLPGYVQKRFLKNTTSIFQMAAVVVFNSPFLCWPDNPEAYLNHPLLPFVRNVPVTWDETRILSGSVIGETVLMARRKGDNWYIAALNCRKEPRRLDLDLSPLDSGGKEMTIYRDTAEGAGIQVEAALPVPQTRKVSLDLRSGGGALIQLQPARTYPGWR